MGKKINKIQKFQDQLILAKESGDTKLIRFLERIIRCLEAKDAKE